MNIIEALNCIRPMEVDRASLLDEALNTRQKLLSDEKQKIKCFTVTLRPHLHKVEPIHIRRQFREMSEKIILPYKSKQYVEIHYEFTEAMVIHMHGIIIGGPQFIGRYIARCRNMFGYTCVKEAFNLSKWLEYCNKENIYRPHYIFN